jgi:NADH-quinone oxidoreductase subunit J
MPGEWIRNIFYFLSALALFSAIMSVFSRNLVHSILYLILCFFAIAGHYLLLSAEFLAIINIIVYAGAIMVLFLFAVMFLNLNKTKLIRLRKINLFISVFSGGFLMLIFIASVVRYSEPMHPVEISSDFGSIKFLGKIVFNDYILPFEVTSILFLTAIVGSVVLIKKEHR